MNRTELFDQLNLLSQSFKKEDRSRIKDPETIMQDIILDYLSKQPSDVDLWVKLMLIQSIPPRADYIAIKDCTNIVFMYDSFNIPALLILMYGYYYLIRSPDEEYPIQRLFDAKSEDKELSAMLEIAKAQWYDEQNNQDLYEHCLLTSINSCQSFAYPYISLGLFYIDNNMISEGKEFLRLGLANVKKIYDETSYDWSRVLDIGFFYEEHYRLTYIPRSYYKKLHDMLNK